MKKCRLISFLIDLALRLLLIDLHFFIATIQIGVCNLYLSREFYHTDIIFGMASVVHSDRVPHNNIIEQAQPIVA